MVKRELTVEDAFNKPKYYNILYLITHYTADEKKIKFIHLRYALCKNHGIKDKSAIQECKNFFKNPFTDRLIEQWNDWKNTGYITEQEMRDLIKLSSMDELEFGIFSGMILQKDKFPSYQTLGNALAKLKKLGLIEPKKDKKGYNYYERTEKSIMEWNRHFIKTLVDNYISDEHIEKLKKFTNDLMLLSRNK